MSGTPANAGTSTFGFQVTDAAGHTASTSLPITISAAGGSTPTPTPTATPTTSPDASIVITSPNGTTTVTSPVTVTAMATGYGGVTATEILVDGTEAYSTSGTTVNTPITMSTGVHELVADSRVR